MLVDCVVVDRYFPLIDRFEHELERIEEQVLQHGRGRRTIERLYALKRRIDRLHHGVAPLMEAVGKLCSGRVPAVCARSEHYFRDVYDHLRRINGSLDASRDTIATAIQVTLSMVTIENAETTKRLAAWAGLFAVATAFAGIWGMNFEYMPELGGGSATRCRCWSSRRPCGWLWWRFRSAGWL